jgi:hypothetical protein
MTNRQPRGIPVGGQFAEGRNPEGGDLASDGLLATYSQMRQVFESSVVEIADGDGSQLNETDHDRLMVAARNFFDNQTFHPPTRSGMREIAEKFVYEDPAAKLILSHGATPPPTPPEDLKATLEAMWQEAESEYNEASKDSADDEENVGYWDGMKAGIGKAQVALADSGWTPPTTYPENEDELMVISMTVNRRTGEVNVTTDEKLSGNTGFQYAYDQLTEAASDIVSSNPEAFITDPLPRTITLKHGTVSASNYDNEHFFLSEEAVKDAEFLQDDGAYVYLKLKDGQVVLLDPIDVEVSDPPF